MRCALLVAEPLHSSPDRAAREAVTNALLQLAKDLGFQVRIAPIEADYFALETGDKQFKNAVSVLRDGITFYTVTDSLLRLLGEHGLAAKESPFRNESSEHNVNRWQIQHVDEDTIRDLRPLFLAMVHESISYVQSS